LRVGSDIRQVVIYLEGGGACYNPWSCENIFTPKFGEEDFGEGKHTGIFALEDEKNPFRTWTQVYIPYCSGDLHSGSVPFGEGYEGKAHWGYQNISLVLKSLVPSLKDADKIIVAGSSAGGFGASYNWLRFQKAFHPVPVDLIDDSGPFLSSQYLPSCFHERVFKLWNQAPALPKDCSECFNTSESFVAPLEYTLRYLPQRRYALLTSVNDFVIRSFFSFTLDDCQQWDSTKSPKYNSQAFENSLEDYHQRMAAYDNSFIYETKGDGHVLFFDDFSDGIRSEQSGIKLYDWINSFLYEDSVQNVLVNRSR
jgi:hypothetical protein